MAGSLTTDSYSRYASVLPIREATVARVADAPGATGTPMYRVMSYNPALLEKFIALRNSYWEDGILEPKLKELVRLLSANINNCEHCKAVRTDWGIQGGAEERLLTEIEDFESHLEDYSDREIAALRYAQSFCFNVGWVDDETFAVTKAQFSDQEIVELTFCLSQFVGGNFFMHALGIGAEGELTPYYGGELAGMKWKRAAES